MSLPKIKYNGNWETTRDILVKRDGTWKSLASLPDIPKPMDNFNNLYITTKANFELPIQPTPVFSLVTSNSIPTSASYESSVSCLDGKIVFVSNVKDQPILIVDTENNDSITTMTPPENIGFYGCIGNNGRVYLFGQESDSEYNGWYPVYSFNPSVESFNFEAFIPVPLKWLWTNAFNNISGYHSILNMAFYYSFNPRTKEFTIPISGLNNGNFFMHSSSSSRNPFMNTNFTTTASRPVRYGNVNDILNTGTYGGAIFYSSSVNQLLAFYSTIAGSGSGLSINTHVYPTAIITSGAPTAYSMPTTGTNGMFYRSGIGAVNQGYQDLHVNATENSYPGKGTSNRALNLYNPLLLNSYHWSGGGVGPNSHIFYPPTDHNYIVEYIYKGGTINATTLGNGDSMVLHNAPGITRGWGPATMSINNDIYFAPKNSGNILKISFDGTYAKLLPELVLQPAMSQLY